ncbi:hypothetical protein [Streptomyces sp. NPDC002403]
MTGIEMRELHDEYGRALEQLVDAKVSGGQVETLPVPQPAADLLAESAQLAGSVIPLVLYSAMITEGVPRRRRRS